MRNKISSFSRCFKILLYAYTVYRLLNIMIISIIDYMDIPDYNNTSEEAPYFIDFEYPAPNINKVIDYEMLGWCHKCLISEDEFMNHDDYTVIEWKITASFLLFPWTMPIDIFSPDNEQYCHQSNEKYYIDVWCGRNVFSGTKEEIFFYHNELIILIPLLSIVLICYVICDIRKLLHTLFQKITEFHISTR